MELDFNVNMELYLNLNMELYLYINMELDLNVNMELDLYINMKLDLYVNACFAKYVSNVVKIFLIKDGFIKYSNLPPPPSTQPICHIAHIWIKEDHLTWQIF